METKVGQAVVASGLRDSGEFLSVPWMDRCMVHLPRFPVQGAPGKRIGYPPCLCKYVRCVGSPILEGITVTDVVFSFYPSQRAGLDPSCSDDVIGSG